jgi:hypothetical protein
VYVSINALFSCRRPDRTLYYLFNEITWELGAYNIQVVAAMLGLVS